ncbi:MAG: hypothetical protein LBG60_14180 [Bifidobacteriaceae bacterium]|jgi:hypothetical protein|nr:hypothetical protein [Bifidobacteriaceae bacterium]
MFDPALGERAARRRLDDAFLPSGDLAIIAGAFPALAPLIAKHPSLYPGLETRLRAMSRADVNAILDARTAAGGDPPAADPAQPPAADTPSPQRITGAVPAPQPPVPPWLAAAHLPGQAQGAHGAAIDSASPPADLDWSAIVELRRPDPPGGHGARPGDDDWAAIVPPRRRGENSGANDPSATRPDGGANWRGIVIVLVAAIVILIGSAMVVFQLSHYGAVGGSSGDPYAGTPYRSWQAPGPAASPVAAVRVAAPDWRPNRHQSGSSA